MVTTNAHTHLDNTKNVHIRPKKPTSFLFWSIRAAREYAKRKDTDCITGIRDGIRKLLDCGTTHIGDISAHWKGVEEVISSALKGVVFLEVLGLQEDKALAKLNEAKAAISKFNDHPEYGAVQIGLSLHSPYTCNYELLKQGAEWCGKEKVPLCIHVAESPLETAILSGKTSTGFPLGWLKMLYRAFPGGSPPRLSPILYLHSLGVLDAKPILIHTVNVTDFEIELLAQKRCAVVHCPRSNYLLSCGRMPLEKFLNAGVVVYLGTDGLSSSPSIDIFDEVKFAKEIHSGFVDEKTIEQLVEKSFP